VCVCLKHDFDDIISVSNFLSRRPEKYFRVVRLTGRTEDWGVYIFVCVYVCVCERERERERMKVYMCEWVFMCVYLWMHVYVCVIEWRKESVGIHVCMFVWDKERERDSVCVFVCVCACLYLCNAKVSKINRSRKGVSRFDRLTFFWREIYFWHSRKKRPDRNLWKFLLPEFSLSFTECIKEKKSDTSCHKLLPRTCPLRHK